jgi:hypothetical protein
VVDHVVAVLGARCRGQQRGAVEVADAQIGEIVGDLGGGRQREVGAHLNAIGARRTINGGGLVGGRH